MIFKLFLIFPVQNDQALLLRNKYLWYWKNHLSFDNGKIFAYVA